VAGLPAKIFDIDVFRQRNQLGKYLASHKTETHLEDKHEQVESGGQLEQAEQQGPQEAPAGVVAQEIGYHIAVGILAKVPVWRGLLVGGFLKVLGVATKVQCYDTSRAGHTT